MRNKRRPAGDTALENMGHLAHHFAAEKEEAALRCAHLLSLVAPDGLSGEAARRRAADLLIEELTEIAKKEAERALQLAQEEARDSPAPHGVVPCAAAGDLLGLLPPEHAIEFARSGKLHAYRLHELSAERETKRHRQARASVWMGRADLKYYAYETRELGAT